MCITTNAIVLDLFTITLGSIIICIIIAIKLFNILWLMQSMYYINAFRLYTKLLPQCI